MPAENTSAIFEVRGADGANGDVKALLSLMKEAGLHFYAESGQPGLIRKDDVVILKVNCQWAERGGTNTDLVKSVIQAITGHPEGFSGEVIIADNGQGQYGSEMTGGKMDWAKTNSKDMKQSNQAVADSFEKKGFKVSAYLWDTITTTRVKEYDAGDSNEGFVVADTPDPDTRLTVSYPKFISKFGTKVSFKLGIWEDGSRSYDDHRLKVINMPVLKTHFIYGMTACVKSYMGTPSDKLTRNAHDSVGTGGMGTQMAKTRMPALNILDAIHINPYISPAELGPNGQMGPNGKYENTVETNSISASTDPVALDYWAQGAIMEPVMEKLGVRMNDLVHRDSTRPGSFGAWLRLAMKEINRAGYNCTIDLDKIKLYTKEI